MSTNTTTTGHYSLHCANTGNSSTQLPPYVVNSLVTENDVLLGRGDHSVKHEGNVRFRKVISSYLNSFCLVQTTTKNKKNETMKNEIARIVIATIINRNGRFLQKATAQDIDRLQIPPNSNAWIPRINEVVLIKKVKQTFRDVHNSTIKKLLASTDGKKQVFCHENDERNKKQQKFAINITTTPTNIVPHIGHGQDLHSLSEQSPLHYGAAGTMQGLDNLAALALWRNHQEHQIRQETEAQRRALLLIRQHHQYQVDRNNSASPMVPYIMSPRISNNTHDLLLMPQVSSNTLIIKNPPTDSYSHHETTGLY